MSEEKGGIGWFLFGFVLGGLAGAAAAMAYTPESGDDIRERMRGKSIELANLARERWEEFSEQARTQIDQVREQVEQGVKSAQEYAADVSEEIGTEDSAKEEESASA